MKMIDDPTIDRQTQMWDRDVLSANDIIAETSIDLYRWFLKVCAIKSMQPLFFKEVQEIRHGTSPQ